MKQVSEIEEGTVIGFYEVECFDSDGNLKWSDKVPNVITDAAKAAMLDTYLAGSGYTATMYMGLLSGTSYTSAP